MSEADESTGNGNRLEALLKKLEIERDELRLKLGLAKLEAREEWQELEKKLETLRGRLKVAGGEARGAGAEVRTAAENLAREIKEGFDRVRKTL